MTSQTDRDSKLLENFIGPLMAGRYISDQRVDRRVPNRLKAPKGPLNLTSTQQLGTARNHWPKEATSWDVLVTKALEPHSNRWDARARQEGLTVGQRVYAAQRARSTATATSARVNACGFGGVWNIKCGCKRTSVESRCNVRHSCDKCATRTRASYASKIEAGLRRELVKLQRRGFRDNAQIRMVTLTARHSGDPVKDRETITKAFGKWHRWLRRALGYAPAYAGSWELTTGEDGLGHAHVHLCFVTTNFPYGTARAVWQNAIGDPEATWNIRSSKNPAKSCQYVAKYVCKVQSGVSDEMHAAWLGGTYGKRVVTASRGMLAKIPCACCRHYWSLDLGPGSIIHDRESRMALTRQYRDLLRIPWKQAELGLKTEFSVLYDVVGMNL